MNRIVGAALAAMLLSACGGGEQVDAAKVLRDGAAAMGKLKTVDATLKLTKGSVTLQGFTLVSARTAVRLPADSDTSYTVKQQGVTIGLEVVISGGHVYLRLPFSPLQEVTGPEAAAFPDMAKLFDSSSGLPAVIPEGLSPKYVSTDQVYSGTGLHREDVVGPVNVYGLVKHSAELASALAPRHLILRTNFYGRSHGARPSFSDVSAVTGSTLATPRTPSVPKIFLC